MQPFLPLQCKKGFNNQIIIYADFTSKKKLNYYYAGMHADSLNWAIIRQTQGAQRNEMYHRRHKISF